MRKSTSLGLILASAIAIATIAVAAPAAAQQGGWHGHGGHGGHGQLMALNKLNLTDAQRASVKQIMQTSFAQNKTQRQALQQQRSAFESMTPDQVGYQAATTSLAQAEGAATQQRVQQRANVRAQIYAVLSTSQKAQLATLQAQQQARKQQWAQFKAQHPVSSTSSTSP
ncbi:MAG: Spy/CpxP family protein refolding chaperone [Rhodanobacter sp.]